MEDSTTRVLRAVHEFIESAGHSPSIRNVADRFGVSTSTAWLWANAAKAAGLLNWEERAPRTMRLTNAGRRHIGINEQGSS